jgi:hypothetical protein
MRRKDFSWNLGESIFKKNKKWKRVFSEKVWRS